MNYLVTGGAGFIGSNLVGKLLQLEHNVVVIDNFVAGKKENLLEFKNNQKLIIYEKDICDDLSNIFKKEKFDAVCHLAALPRVQFSIANPIKTNNVNITGTLNILETCKKFSVNRFVFSSSSSVYGEQNILPIKESAKVNPISPYALQKLTGEYYCKLFHLLYGLKTVSLRYFNIYGPKQDPNGSYACLIPKFIQMMSKGKSPLINGDGEQTRDFTYVEDVVNANIKATETNNEDCFGEAFNIGSGNNFSINDVVKKIAKFANNNVKTVYGPAVIEPKNTLADIEKAKIKLNWIPLVSFDDGLKKSYYFTIKQNG